MAQVKLECLPVGEMGVNCYILENPETHQCLVVDPGDEGERILARIPQGAYTVALCVEGKQMSSPDLSRKLESVTAECGTLCFIIGSSHGLAPEVKSAAKMRLSVSELTFPHQLMRVILYEAVYRCYQIAKGSKYHK